MKGVQGLILAIGLGVAGALFNWAYLYNSSRDVEKINFIGIKPGATINRGEVLREDQLVPVGIPERWVGNLKDFALLWDTRQTVIGSPVWRTIGGETLLLAEDLKTPPQELKLGENERAMWIPVDTRGFVPSLVLPGDTVSFIASRSQMGAPTPAKPPEQPADGAGNELASAPTGPTEIIGPFTILSLGNRLGSPEVMRAAKIPQVQENVMTIAVKVIKVKKNPDDPKSPEYEELEEKAATLWKVLQATNFRQVGVLLHERKTNKP